MNEQKWSGLALDYLVDSFRKAYPNKTPVEVYALSRKFEKEVLKKGLYSTYAYFKAKKQFTPSTIQAETGLSENTVYRHINELKKMKLIKFVTKKENGNPKGGAKSSIYGVCL